MAGKFVLDGAKIKCPLCSKPEGELKATSNQVQVQDKPAATTGDNSKPNLKFDGNCTHPQFSGNQPPCQQVMALAQWQNTSDVTFDGNKALVDNSTIMCQTGGVPITIEDTTQKATPTNLQGMYEAGAPVPAPVPSDNEEAGGPNPPSEPNYNSFVLNEPVDTGLKGELTIRDALFARRKETPKYDDRETIYTIKPGDTLSGIAEDHDTTVAAIKEENGLDHDRIEAGDPLTITTKVVTGKDISYEQINSATLGQEVWVAVAYMGEADSISVELVEKEPLLTDDGTLPVLQDGSETTTIELREPDESRWQDYRMVTKVTLRPEGDDDLDNWREKLTSEDGATNKSLLSIRVAAEGGEEVEEVAYRGTNNSNVFLGEEGAWFEVKKKDCCISDLTKEQLKSIAIFASDKNIKKYIDGLNLAMKENNINTCLRKVHFLAQLIHESGSFVYTRESKVPNSAYGGYPGRGLMQITLESNYKAYEQFVNEDVTSTLANKQKLERPPHAARSAGWFWAQKAKLNDDADRNDLIYITRLINGGFNGYNDRLRWVKKGFDVLYDKCQNKGKNKKQPEYMFKDSQAYNDNRASFAWGLWHDPGLNKKGCNKDKQKAISGYRRFVSLVGDNCAETNWYRIKTIAKFSNLKYSKVVNGEPKTYIRVIEAAKQRLNKLKQ